MSTIQMGRALSEATAMDWMVFIGLAAFVVIVVGFGAGRPEQSPPRSKRRGKDGSGGGDGGTTHGSHGDGDGGGGGGD